MRTIRLRPLRRASVDALEARTHLAATFQGLGDLPGGGFWSQVNAMSADGSTVVGTSDAGAFNQNAFRWTRQGGMEDLGTWWASGVSADGSVIGGLGRPSVYRWTGAAGTVEIARGDFGDVPVSDDGSVLAGPSGTLDVFRWTQETGPVNIPPLHPGRRGLTADLSGDGTTIVGSWQTARGDEAFRWTAAEGTRGLGHFRNGSNSSATGASADGSVVVGFSNDEQTGMFYEAFRWTAATGLVGLGDLRGGLVDSRAFDVSDDGFVVVGASNTGRDGEAFVWTSAHGMRNLASSLIAQGAHLGEWRSLNWANAVSADGTVVAGVGINPDDRYEAFVATFNPTVPPPSGTVSGVKYHDLDADATRDEGEPGLSGWTVYVDTDDNGFFDQFNEPSAVTGPDGRYSIAFTDVRLGRDYSIREVQQPGWVATQPAGPGYVVRFDAAGQTVSRDFGAYQPASIRGVFFDDDDGDGVRDPDEMIVYGWSAYLDLNDNGRLDPETEEAHPSDDGSYAIHGLAPGRYVVRAGPERPDVPPRRVTVGSGQDVEVDFAVPAAAATVAGRHVFYNNSDFDAQTPGAGPRDDAAIAPDKVAHLDTPDNDPPTFSNVTSYAKGINGVMIDLANLPPGAEPALTSEDFDFHGALRPVSVSVRRGAGAGGSDRVTLIWTDYSPGIEVATLATANGWLTVTVKANERTGLVEPDFFRFGNLIGETGDVGGTLGWRVNGLDLAAVRRSLNTPAPISSPTDFNRDGRTNALDMAIVRRQFGETLGPPPGFLEMQRRASERSWVSGLLA